jgi:hypothetical protein
MLALCEHVYQHHVQVDEIISRLKEVKEPLDEKKLEIIVREHGRFCHLLAPILRGNRAARSFAAKYLHCHCSAVPIYDSVAVCKLGIVCPWEDRFEVFKRPDDADENYYWFALRFLPFYRAARELRPNVTVRLLDLYLLFGTTNRFVMDSLEGVRLVNPETGESRLVNDMEFSEEELE